MKRLLLCFAVFGLLVGCTQSASDKQFPERITYRFETDMSDPAKNSVLLLGTTRVIEGRLKAMGEEYFLLETHEENGETTIEVGVDDKRVLELLTDTVQGDFKLRVMKEAPEDEAAFIEVRGHGRFMDTDVTEEHVEWMEAERDTNPEQGKITVVFTEEGRTLMAKVFEENKGKYIGLFVRDQLMSKLLVDTDEVLDDIVITEIPAFAIADMFAHDVNVGLHVTLTPLD